jgi:hypothetical protein
MAEIPVERKKGGLPWWLIPYSYFYYYFRCYSFYLVAAMIAPELLVTQTQCYRAAATMTMRTLLPLRQTQIHNKCEFATS